MGGHSSSARCRRDYCGDRESGRYQIRRGRDHRETISRSRLAQHSTSTGALGKKYPLFILLGKYIQKRCWMPFRQNRTVLATLLQLLCIFVCGEGVYEVSFNLSSYARSAHNRRPDNSSPPILSLSLYSCSPCSGTCDFTEQDYYPYQTQ